MNYSIGRTGIKVIIKSINSSLNKYKMDIIKQENVVSSIIKSKQYQDLLKAVDSPTFITLSTGTILDPFMMNLKDFDKEKEFLSTQLSGEELEELSRLVKLKAFW